MLAVLESDHPGLDPSLPPLPHGRYRDPLAGVHPMTDPAERLMARVAFEPNTGCWIFSGRWDKDGYGMFHLDGRTIFRGRLPRAREIDHTCSVRACCNPDHLEAVSRCTNMHRVFSRRRKTA